MNNQKKINKSIYEGIFFMIIGVSLIIYSLISYSQSFNQDWSQSPYAFPILVAIFICLLSTSLLVSGIKKNKDSIDNNKDNLSVKPNIKGVAVILLISAVYYFALAVVDMPIITLTILSLSISFSTFEISTIIFLFVLLKYLKVSKNVLLIFIPIITTILLSIAFRTLLHVLLP
ncbi:uncharacterized membrane protein YidH (DUF202 family) [Sedimentibacter acidaminivorans]|uniref:Uncharacterized membrane protein YidH (DUF202 family) n=1 Tax=Sedimentibacter acidaminivorans TaxID=913099 RepID=A0ABS4G9N7_9FIRM|nr:tripartite tricarboxylate transporter TctB family protein [Sedimentibacter acidaminivorans]MBP1924397.1 uncharacterized membrane protein YidH (DUF202 family) [Sedimentibacter acidaminivorans]